MNARSLINAYREKSGQDADCACLPVFGGGCPAYGRQFFYIVPDHCAEGVHHQRGGQCLLPWEASILLAAIFPARTIPTIMARLSIFRLAVEGALIRMTLNI